MAAPTLMADRGEMPVPRRLGGSVVARFEAAARLALSCDLRHPVTRRSQASDLAPEFKDSQRAALLSQLPGTETAASRQRCCNPRSGLDLARRGLAHHLARPESIRGLLTGHGQLTALELCSCWEGIAHFQAVSVHSRRSKVGCPQLKLMNSLKWSGAGSWSWG